MDIPPAALPDVIVGCIFTSLAFIVVVLRLCSRALVLRNVGPDDYLIVLATISSIGFLTAVMIQIQRGLGRPIEFPEVPNFLQALYVTVVVYSATLTFCKLSITVQCYRVFRQPEERKFMKIFFVVIVICGLWTNLSSIFTCWPVDFYWNAPLGEQGSCMGGNVVAFINAAINIVTDLILVAIPLVLLRNLQIPKAQKHILLGVFALGLLVPVSSVVRLHSLYIVATAPPPEQSVAGVPIALWSCVEANVAIFCASVPALKPLVAKFLPKGLLSDIYARSRATYGDGATGTRRRNMMSRDPMATVGDIKVEHSIEMHSSPGKLSRDGSEKGLVAGTATADCRATPSDEGLERKPSMRWDDTLRMV